jgi:hypothetical protein
MAKWISQKDCPSTTDTSVGRTAYLAPLANQVKQAIETYLAQCPDAEDVTLAVCEVIGPRAVEDLTSNVKASRRNTDLGLFVAQKLVELYGEERVLTLRQDDGSSAQTRPNHRASRDWVTAYTPHRVLPATPGRTDRILLDTSAVRKVIHGDADALDLARLKQLRGDNPVSLADSSIAELASALFDGRVKINDWTARVLLFDDVVDRDLPFAPGGSELSALAGLRDAADLDLDGMQAHLQAAWQLFRSITTAADLSKKIEYTTGNGQRFQISLDGLRTKGALDEAATGWKKWTDNARTSKAEIAESGDVPDEEELREMIRNDLHGDLSDASLDKLDVAIRVIAKRTAQLKSGKSGYTPKGYNDALDFDLLYGLALPAVVCTGDERLVRLARSTTASESWRVMNAADLLDWLAKQRSYV